MSLIPPVVHIPPNFPDFGRKGADHNRPSRKRGDEIKVAGDGKEVLTHFVSTNTGHCLATPAGSSWKVQDVRFHKKSSSLEQSSNKGEDNVKAKKRPNYSVTV